MRGALGACHALELPFVFGTLHLAGVDRFVGAGPAADALSGQMMESGRRCANGRPWFSGLPRRRRATMVFGAESGLKDSPLEEERALWDGGLAQHV